MLISCWRHGNLRKSARSSQAVWFTTNESNAYGETCSNVLNPFTLYSSKLSPYKTVNEILKRFSVFSAMEEERLIDPSDDADIYCLHLVCDSLLDRTLHSYRNGWNNHRLSSKRLKNKSPNQLFRDGLQRLKDEGMPHPELHQVSLNHFMALVISRSSTSLFLRNYAASCMGPRSRRPVLWELNCLSVYHRLSRRKKGSSSMAGLCHKPLH